jgi:hypothetical protein
MGQQKLFSSSVIMYLTHSHLSMNQFKRNEHKKLKTGCLARHKKKPWEFMSDRQ